MNTSPDKKIEEYIEEIREEDTLYINHYEVIRDSDKRKIGTKFLRTEEIKVEIDPRYVFYDVFLVTKNPFELMALEESIVVNFVG